MRWLGHISIVLLFRHHHAHSLADAIQHVAQRVSEALQQGCVAGFAMGRISFVVVALGGGNVSPAPAFQPRCAAGRVARPSVCIDGRVVTNRGLPTGGGILRNPRRALGMVVEALQPCTDCLCSGDCRFSLIPSC